LPIDTLNLLSEPVMFDGGQLQRRNHDVKRWVGNGRLYVDCYHEQLKPGPASSTCCRHGHSCCFVNRRQSGDSASASAVDAAEEQISVD